MPYKDIIGHKKVIQGLQQLVREGHLPHALLFTGPEGIGKRHTAAGLAKALLCDNLENDYCDTCKLCHTINQGIHPDVALIEPEGDSIKIEQMRQWRKNLESRPYMGSWRVIIIDNAEKMTQAAANSVLKALEEPPEDTLICLTAKEARDLLPTIVSRCQTIRFFPLSRPDFCQILMNRNTNMTKAQAVLVYNLSNGQLSKGLNMDIDYLSNLRKKWREFFHSDYSGAYSKIKTDKQSILEGLDIILYWVRDILLLQLGLDESCLTHQDMLRQLREEARVTPYSVIQSRIDNVLQTIEVLERNANPKLALDCLLWEWNKDFHPEIHPTPPLPL